MTPEHFIQKWTSILKPQAPGGATERAYSQEHFIDLCRLIGHKTPAECDPNDFRFEKPLTKITLAKGYADVWKRGFFGWEYKGPHKDLQEAYVQLKTYSDALENPPLLIVSDMWRFVIHTNFTATIKETQEFTVDQLHEPEVLEYLRAAFTNPERLRPNVTRAMVTEDAAKRFAELARSLGERYEDKKSVAHFLDRLIFCMFAEDIGLLPDQVFSKMTEAALVKPGDFQSTCRALFSAMAEGGQLWITPIKWFNGGLFDGTDALELTLPEIKALHAAAKLDWSNIEPAIFGTLFERGLDPGKRSQLGAHYTDPGTIMRLIDPVIREPWERAWEAEKEHLIPLVDRWHGGKGGPATRARKSAERRVIQFLEKLKAFRVLDPACGSGNFLYLALKALKDFEKKVRTEVGMMGLSAGLLFEVSPENLFGIEINPYAAELARVAVWIGELQWMIQNGYSYRENPILRKLEQIECRDALVTEEGTEASWPAADVIVGNPPFVGNKKLLRELGDESVDRIRKVYDGRVPHGVDLVAYWFEKARAEVERGTSQRVGLVATNSIRGGDNRKVLQRIQETGTIFDAWSDQPWVNDGASVRVSMVSFEAKVREIDRPVRLDGEPVSAIYADLSGVGFDLTQAKRLPPNRGLAFMGDTKGGAFDVPGEQARAWIQQPNPHGRSNGNVLKPWMNGRDVTRRASDNWIIDFGWSMDESDASRYEAPFQHIQEHVRPLRLSNRREQYRRYWWRHVEPRPGMWQALSRLHRYIATPTVSKHRLFVWISRYVCPDHQLIVIAKEDDVTFGVLHSYIHELWSLRMGSWLGVGNDPRYTPTSTFETFPFPPGLTLDVPVEDHAQSADAQQISLAARQLVTLRDNWLNPPEWVVRLPEVVPTYPDRVLPKPGHEADLKKRTLTNLYNMRPAWLEHAHRELDQAVAAAYGWAWPLPDEEILRRLLALNMEQSSLSEVSS